MYQDPSLGHTYIELQFNILYKLQNILDGEKNKSNAVVSFLQKK